MITCSHFEYERLNTELRERIEKAQNQSLLLCSVLFAYLIALIGLVLKAYKYFLESSDNKTTLYFFCLLIAVTLLPIFVISSFSAKYYDNIAGIRSLSIYVMIFHEIPSMINSRKTKSDTEIIGWEALHESILSNKRIRKAVGIEYLTSATIFIITAFIVFIIAHVVMVGSGYYSLLLPKFDFAALATIILVSAWNLKQIRLHTDIDLLFKDQRYATSLLLKAVDSGLIEKNDFYCAFLYLVQNEKDTF